MNTAITHSDEDREPQQDQASLQILILSAGIYSTLPLPRAGRLVLGRASSCDVQLDDPLASRFHARLTVGEPLLIEDLGSANGTRLRGQRFPPGSPQELELGEAVEIGGSTLIVQQARYGLGSRQLWSYESFEARLRDECARSAATGATFALLRLRIRPSVPWNRVVPVLARELMPPNAFRARGPDDYELLFLDSPALDAFVTRVRSELSARDLEVQVAIARYPDHGRSADALVGHLAEAMAPAKEGRPAPAVVPTSDPTLQRVWLLAERAAGSSISVLICGETGVGKDVLAGWIHDTSARRGQPLVNVDCGALTPALIESELFGHEKGAFTGADQPKPGLLEMAQGGTVLLGEVGELPLSAQTTLLRVLETRQCRRVGGLQPRTLDVRFLATTHRDLLIDVERGTFRSDSYYRLAGMVLTVPPLRQRRGDIAPLVASLVNEACTTEGRPVPRVSAEAMELLSRHSWPGNIRELKNLMERAVLMATDEIGPEQLPQQLVTGAEAIRPGATLVDDASASPLRDDVRQLERQRIIEALEKSLGNQSQAAKALGMPRRTFVSKLDLYAIPRPRKGV